MKPFKNTIFVPFQFNALHIIYPVKHKTKKVKLIIFLMLKMKEKRISFLTEGEH